jgi:signal peptidase I
MMKTFVVQTFTIPSGSMENTLLVGDRIMVNLRADPATLHRGDIIVFEDPGGWITTQTPTGGPLGVVRKGLEFVGLAPVSKGHLVKRVIGLPGDHLVCCDAKRRMTINGVVVQEDYLYPGELASRDDFNVTVPAGRLWVMGDHRSVSSDSRYNLPSDYLLVQEHATKNPGTVPAAPPAAVSQATIPYDLVVGRVVWRMWPLTRLGSVDGGG